ncbi:hypothetical protein ACVIWV_001456 [Bradyrhizobium diazoefficiens]
MPKVSAKADLSDPNDILIDEGSATESLKCDRNPRKSYRERGVKAEFGPPDTEPIIRFEYMTTGMSEMKAT